MILLTRALNLKETHVVWCSLKVLHQLHSFIGQNKSWESFYLHLDGYGLQNEAALMRKSTRKGKVKIEVSAPSEISLCPTLEDEPRLGCEAL